MRICYCQLLYVSSLIRRFLYFLTLDNGKLIRIQKEYHNVFSIPLIHKQAVFDKILSLQNLIMVEENCSRLRSHYGRHQVNGVNIHVMTLLKHVVGWKRRKSVKMLFIEPTFFFIKTIEFKLFKKRFCFKFYQEKVFYKKLRP